METGTAVAPLTPAAQEVEVVAVAQPDPTIEREGPEPVVLVPATATYVTPTLLVVGWCCWDAPLHPAAASRLCSMAHCMRAGTVVVCRCCQREYGVFVNRSALGGAVVLTAVG